MLFTLAVILLIAWLLGMVTAGATHVAVATVTCVPRTFA